MSDGRTPEKQAPAHPAAGKTATSAKRHTSTTTRHKAQGTKDEAQNLDQCKAYKNPIDNQGTAAMTIVPISSASM
jgi:hypothetical protein